MPSSGLLNAFATREDQLMGDSPMPAPEVFVGVDIAKGKHYACAVSASGVSLFSRAVLNDEGAIRTMISDAGDHGRPALVVDMTSSAAVLALTVAAEVAIPVAYVTGLSMRRAADLYAGAAKTDPKDAQVLADFAWRNADRLTWTSITDELLARLRILNGRDTDLAADATRAANRLRDALLAVSPALERVVGVRLMSTPGLRAALVRWPTPTALRTVGKAHVRALISKRSKRTATKLTDEIWAALRSQTVTVVAEATWGETIGDLAADLDRIIAVRQRLAADIEEAFLEHPLRTSPQQHVRVRAPHRRHNPR